MAFPSARRTWKESLFKTRRAALKGLRFEISSWEADWKGANRGRESSCKAAVERRLASRLPIAQSTTIRKTESPRMRSARRPRSRTTWLTDLDQRRVLRKTEYRLDLARRVRSKGTS